MNLIRPSSMRRTLLLWLGGGISVGILLAATSIYLEARQQANELFDYQMRQVVASLPVRQALPFDLGRSGVADSQEDIVIQMWNDHGLRLYRSHEGRYLPQHAELGFTDVEVQGTSWRVYSAQLGDAVIQVAQPVAARRAMAARMAWKTVAPLFLLFPLLSIVVWVSISRNLRPVATVTRDLQARNVDSLEPIHMSAMPEEIAPLTEAINGLFERVKQSLELQHHFIADAAHELKTPLTALKLQLHLAHTARTDEDRARALADLKRGIDRASHLVNQLLTLARQTSGASPTSQQDVALLSVLTASIQDLEPLARTKSISITLDTSSPVHIAGEPDSLRTMFNNVIDNAIRYCPTGCTIRAAIETSPTQVMVRIRDDGPGVAPEEISRLTDRFYRVPGTQTEGSGLGLAIVREIAQRHGASLQVCNAFPGLEVRICFPPSITNTPSPTP